MLSVICAECCKQAHNAKWHYAECHYAECHYAECHYAECYFAECHFAKYPTFGKMQTLEISFKTNITNCESFCKFFVIFL
jgi:hypothetical protein